MRVVPKLVLGFTLSAAMSFGALIDNFSTSQSISTSTTATNGVATGANSIGGARAITLTRDSGSEPVTVLVNDAGNGLLQLVTGPSVAAHFLVIYDGNQDAVVDTTGLGANLTAGGMTTMRVAYRADLTIPVTVRVYTDAANFSDATFNTTSTGFGANPFFLRDLLFSSFTVAGGAGANFSNVGAITLLVDASNQPATDIELDFLSTETTVPEPATVAVTALGVLGLAVARFRRK